MNWSGLPKTITDYHRLPLTDWFYSIEHSKLYPGLDGMDGIYVSLTPPTTRSPLAVLTMITTIMITMIMITMIMITLITMTQILNVGLEWAGFPALSFYMHTVLKQLQVSLPLKLNLARFKSFSSLSTNTGWPLPLVDTDRP